jgi:hypothetical protein
MELNFFEPEHAPQPKEKVKIERLSAKAYPDGWRLRVNVDVTPFQERPSLEVMLISADGRPVAEIAIIETMHKSMEFTIHLRGVSTPNGNYTLAADLYYGDDRSQVQHRLEVPFSIQV